MANYPQPHEDGMMCDHTNLKHLGDLKPTVKPLTKGLKIKAAKFRCLQCGQIIVRVK